MDIAITIIIHVSLGVLIFFMGFATRKWFYEKTEGRFVIDEKQDEYYVAITARTEELKKKDIIMLDVIAIEDMSKLIDDERRS